MLKVHDLWEISIGSIGYRFWGIVGFNKKPFAMQFHGHTHIIALVAAAALVTLVAVEVVVPVLTRVVALLAVLAAVAVVN